MPPALDVYVLTDRRNSATVALFLDTFVDRSQSEDRGDEELMVLLPANLEEPSEQREQNIVIWEPARTLTHAVGVGLENRHRAFSLYLTSRSADIERAILTFTTDGQLVLGLSIEDEGALPESEQRAREILARMTDLFDASAGLIIVESSPPMNEGEFQRSAPNPLAIYFWRR